jgi:hypothetical protein
MVEFVTLFLRLTMGLQMVEVVVDHPQVHHVTFEVNGQVVAQVTEPPWRAECDFGSRPKPTLLEAFAFDEDGRLLESARQMVNVPQPSVEVRLVVERDDEGLPVAVRVISESHDLARPAEIVVMMGGRLLKPAGENRFVIPPVDVAMRHLVVADVEFPGGTVVQSVIAFGGGWGSQASTEVTAVAIERDDDLVVPTPDDLEGCLTARSKPVDILAVERGGYRMYVVKSATATMALRHFRQVRPRAEVKDVAKTAQFREDGFVVVSSIPLSRKTTPVNVYPRSKPLVLDKEGLAWVATRLNINASLRAEDALLGEAVATAGLHAAGVGAPRVVVLFVHANDPELGQLTVSDARRFLGRLGVPLEVVAVLKDVPGVGPSTRVRNTRELARLQRRVEDRLGRQLIVWVEGIHLPTDIEVGCGYTKVGASRTDGPDAGRAAGGQP